MWKLPSERVDVLMRFLTRDGRETGGTQTSQDEEEEPYTVYPSPIYVPNTFSKSLSEPGGTRVSTLLLLHLRKTLHVWKQLKLFCQTKVCWHHSPLNYRCPCRQKWVIPGCSRQTLTGFWLVWRSAGFFTKSWRCAAAASCDLSQRSSSSSYSGSSAVSHSSSAPGISPPAAASSSPLRKKPRRGEFSLGVKTSSLKMWHKTNIQIKLI